MREACLSASKESMYNVDSALLRSSARALKTSLLSMTGRDLTGNSPVLHKHYLVMYVGGNLPGLSLRFLGCLM